MPQTISKSVTFLALPSKPPKNDLETHTSYLAKSGVECLPVRRIITKEGILRDSVILLNELSLTSPSVKSNQDSSLLLRIKHVAIDFSSDFSGNHAKVPGCRFIGKIPSKQAISIDGTVFYPDERLMVFPYSTCSLLKSDMPCDNCTFGLESGIGQHEAYRKQPCLRNYRYGIDIDGGLQDYIRVVSPGKSIVKIPSSVSLHDACFLFDIALPFLSFCVNVLLPKLAQASDGRLLIILQDTPKEANDCLLVVRHLGLDPSIITFTDLSILKARRDLRRRYRGKFKHIMVFDSSQEALDYAIWFGVGVVSTAPQQTEGTLCVLGNTNQAIHPKDRVLYRYNLSLGDKALFEDLLRTLADLSKPDASVIGMPRFIDNCLCVKTTETDDNSLSSDLTPPDSTTPKYPENSDFKASNRSSKSGADEGSRDDAHTENFKKSSGRISWLSCDRDFRLCSDDNCDHAASARCHHTEDINKMIIQKNPMKRVFYTHRSACHLKLNAFVF